MVTALAHDVVGFVPCGRRLQTGEPAALYRDAIYCPDCVAMFPILGTAPREFALERGAVCGGGSPLD